MRARSSLTEDQRQQLVDLFEQGAGYVSAANRLKVGRYAARCLYHRWQLRGKLCLVEKQTNQQYSFEIKKEIVDRLHAGETAMSLAKEFNVSAPTLIRAWARAWRKHGDEALKPKPKGRPKGSTKSAPLTEMDKLQRKVEQLEAENAYLKKLRDLRTQGRG